MKRRVENVGKKSNCMREENEYNTRRKYKEKRS